MPLPLSSESTLAAPFPCWARATRFLARLGHNRVGHVALLHFQPGNCPGSWSGNSELGVVAAAAGRTDAGAGRGRCGSDMATTTVAMTGGA